MERKIDYSFQELLEKYLNSEEISVLVRLADEDEDAHYYLVSFMNDGVIHNHITFVPTDFLNEIVYLTQCERATNYLRQQPTLMLLIEEIIHKVMTMASKEERAGILDKYDDLESDLFIDESAFFTVRYILRKLIDDKNN